MDRTGTGEETAVRIAADELRRTTMVDKEKVETEEAQEPTEAPVILPPDGGTEFPAEGDSSALNDPETEETAGPVEESDEE